MTGPAAGTVALSIKLPGADPPKEQLLARLPERLHALTDLVLGGKMHAGDVAYAVAALINSLENAPGDARKVY